MYKQVRFYFISICVVSFLIFSACTERQIKSYGFLDESEQNRVSLVDLKTVTSFSSLAKKSSDLACRDSIVAIKMRGKEYDKLIAFHSYCWGEVGRIKMRNILQIRNDSIYKTQMVPLDSIDHYIYDHYFNPDKSLFFSENPRKSIICLQYDDGLNINNLENTLDKITDSYDKLKLEIPLIIIPDSGVEPSPTYYRKAKQY